MLLWCLVFQVFVFEQVEGQLCVYYNVGFGATVLQGDKKKCRNILFIDAVSYKNFTTSEIHEWAWEWGICGM